MLNIDVKDDVRKFKQHSAKEISRTEERREVLENDVSDLEITENKNGVEVTQETEENEDAGDSSVEVEGKMKVLCHAKKINIERAVRKVKNKKQRFLK